MHEILNGQDIILAQRILDDRVIGQRKTLTIDFAVTTLVDQLANGLQVWFSNVISSLTAALSRTDKRTHK